MGLSLLWREGAGRDDGNLKQQKWQEEGLDGFWRKAESGGIFLSAHVAEDTMQGERKQAVC